MRPMLFGKKDPKRQRKAWSAVPDGTPFDSASSTQLLTPEFDKGNDDVTAIRSSLGLLDTKHPAQE